jgi:hypothetical protein
MSIGKNELAVGAPRQQWFHFSSGDSLAILQTLS